MLTNFEKSRRGPLDPNDRREPNREPPRDPNREPPPRENEPALPPRENELAPAGRDEKDPGPARRLPENRLELVDGANDDDADAGRDDGAEDPAE